MFYAAYEMIQALIGGFLGLGLAWILNRAKRLKGKLNKKHAILVFSVVGLFVVLVLLSSWLFAPRRDITPAVVLQIHLAYEAWEEQLGFVETNVIKTTIHGSEDVIYMGKHPGLEIYNTDIRKARVILTEYGFTVNAVLTKSGSEKLAAFTLKNIRKKVAMMVEGKVLAAPIIVSEIKKQIHVRGRSWTEADAERIAALFNSE